MKDAFKYLSLKTSVENTARIVLVQTQAGAKTQSPNKSSEVIFLVVCDPYMNEL
jgi:hypothetical protein